MKKKVILPLVVAFAVITLGATACAPSIPHTTAGRADCLSCHGPQGVKPYPGFHAKDGFTNDRCMSCHHVVPATTK